MSFYTTILYIFPFALYQSGIFFRFICRVTQIPRFNNVFYVSYSPICHIFSLYLAGWPRFPVFITSNNVFYISYSPICHIFSLYFAGWPRFTVLARMGASTSENLSNHRRQVLWDGCDHDDPHVFHGPGYGGCDARRKANAQGGYSIHLVLEILINSFFNIRNI